MKPFEKISYKGEQICVVHISNSAPKESISLIKEAQQRIARLPPESGLILTDVTDAVYNQEGAAAIKEFALHNTPYVKASAVVGADGLRSISLKSVALLTRREIKPFKTRDEALEWLVNLE